MSVVAARKKSTAQSPSGLQIDTPVAHNTFLNKSAAQSTSLYQQCSQLRARLIRIHNFPPYFAISNPSQNRSSTDPVTQLWDCFALGIPLCFLHNLLPNVSPITAIDTDPANFDPSDEKVIKKAINHFVMAVKKADINDDDNSFSATSLMDRHSTDGFVKAMNCVIRLVENIPQDCFEEAPPMSPPSQIPSQDSSDSLIHHPDSPVQPPPANAQEIARNNIVRELVETERKYVQDLEHMQKYANALSSANAIDLDTIHLLFPGLGKLLDFQRRFLIKLESSAELPWKEQRWGLHFIENEQEFNVYEPYCANYSNAVEIMMSVEQNLMTVTFINAKSELPAFLIKPVQRICKYPLLLESLLKVSSEADYPFHDELRRGLDAAKRITDRINEAQRRSENLQTVKSLESRVEDWKGHHLSNFGDLILDDIFMVMKMDIDREYHVFLFEKIILCCKEVLPNQQANTGRKGSKSNSILKKQPLPIMSGGGRKKNTPLLLKGRIFLNNVTHTRPQNYMGNYSLQVWWRGDDDNEYFTLRCKNEEQLKLWETQINRLIERTNARKNSIAHMHAHSSQQSRLLYDSSRKLSVSTNVPSYSSTGPLSSASSSSRPYLSSTYEYEEVRSRSGSIANGTYYPNSTFSAGPSGYPPDEDYEPDDDFEEYPPANGHYTPSSGRGTPLGSRRGNVAQSMLQEREPSSTYERPRARTEDQNGPVMRQWRKNGQAHTLPPPLPPPVGQLPNPLVNLNLSRPLPPSRMASDFSEASFGNGVSGSRPQPPPLRSKFSSNRLNSAYDVESERAASPVNRTPRPPLRSRSASQPSAYVPPPQVPAPPLPRSNWTESSKSSAAGSESSKRGSGSSQSTGESSEYSPHSASPVTPFGSSDSSLAGSTLRTSRSQVTISKTSQVNFSPLVKVKVHFFDDIFVVQVPRATEFTDLVERIGKKIRLCGPQARRDDGPLKIKYVDEDGDMISLGSTEDVQMAFETLRPGNQVTFYVT